MPPWGWGRGDMLRRNAEKASALTLPRMAVYDGASLGRCQTCDPFFLKISLVE